MMSCVVCVYTVEPLSNLWGRRSVIVSEVSSFQRHARVVLGVGKGVLFREVSSVQECPHRDRGSYYTYMPVCMYSMVDFVRRYLLKQV